MTLPDTAASHCRSQANTNQARTVLRIEINDNRVVAIKDSRINVLVNVVIQRQLIDRASQRIIDVNRNHLVWAAT